VKENNDVVLFFIGLHIHSIRQDVLSGFLDGCLIQ